MNATLTTHPRKAVQTPFRFRHRGVSDFGGLFKVYRDNFNINVIVVLRLTGMSLRSVAKLRTGESPSAKQEKALVEMDRLFDGLARVMNTAQVGHWLTQPNAAFDGSTPQQVVERGETDRIWRMLYEIESGQPG